MADFAYQFVSADDYISELKEKSKIDDKYRFLLACALMDGVLVEKDCKSSQEVVGLLTNNGYSWAKLKLADMLSEFEENLIRTEPDFRDVCRLLEEATKCRDVCPPAWVKLGWMWALGLGGKQQNLEEAKRCCEKYGKNDGASGELLSFIDRVENNQYEGTSNLKNNKDTDGQVRFQSNMMYLIVGLDLMPDDYVEGSSVDPLDSNVIAGEFRWGKMCFYGLGTMPDHCKAKRHIAIAAEGNDEAQRFLASMYHRGLGVGKNDAKAIELYECAAETDPRAQYELGVLLGQKGNEKGWSEAFQLLEEVAFHESDVRSDAQCLLGDVYRFGLLGCECNECNRYIAEDLYVKASKQGNIIAQLRLEDLRSRI